MEVKKKKRICDPQLRRWTMKEFYKLGEAGFFRNQRVELIEGKIYMMLPMNAPHANSIHLAAAALQVAFGAGYFIRMQIPLRLGPRSEVYPDLAVVLGSPRTTPQHPTTALLIVEISSTTLWYDRHRKAGLYARAGVDDYWIVNLKSRRLEVRRNPVADAARPYGFTYASVTPLEATDAIAPLAAQGACIAVADLLP